MPATLHFDFRQHWRELRRGEPGRRFQERYRRAHETKPGRTGQRIVLIVVAVLALAIGLVLSVIPGPAFPFFILAGGLLASESRVIARFMDGLEVRVRAVADWAKRRWRQQSRTGRGALVAVTGLALAGAAYGAYRFVSG